MLHIHFNEILIKSFDRYFDGIIQTVPFRDFPLYTLPFIQCQKRLILKVIVCRDKSKTWEHNYGDYQTDLVHFLTENGLRYASGPVCTSHPLHVYPIDILEFPISIFLSEMKYVGCSLNMFV